MRRHKVLIFLFIAAYVHAQSAAMVADTTSLVLDEVVVSAQKAPKSVASSAPVREVNQLDMLRSGITDVSDALHRMPGVNLRDYGGAGGLKTVSVRGFGAGHTGIFYDGVPLSNVQSGQIDLSRYSIDNVKNISLVIGDNEDIFIPARLAASAATVNISSQPVLDNTELTAKLRVGSFGLYNPFVRAGFPLGHTAALNIVGEFTHADNNYPFKLTNGNIVTKEIRNNSRINSGNVETNLLWQINDNNKLVSKIYYYNNSRQLPGPVIYYNNESHEHLREQNIMAQSQLRSRLADGLSMNSIVKFDFASSFYHDRNGKYPGGILDQKYWQREYYASCALLYALTQQCMADYSIDYSFNNLNSNLRSDRLPFRHSILQSITTKVKTTHLTLMARLLGSIYINGAQNGEAAKDAYKLSPSLSLSYQPFASHQWHLRASYKNIFRMPTFNEAYFDHYGSTNILPESTDQINIGSTYSVATNTWLRTANFTVDAYLNNIHDMIVAVPYNMFIWNMVNLGKVRTVGIDATSEISLSPKQRHQLTMAINYSYQRAMPRTNPESNDWMKQVAYIPKHSGCISLSYENPFANISFTTTGVSARYTTNANLPATKIDGYIDCGATAWRKFHINRLCLDTRIDIQNIFNTQYYIVARYPMPGRQYKFTISFNY